MQNSKTSKILLILLIILVLGFGVYLTGSKKSNQTEIPVDNKTFEKENNNRDIKDTYTYTKYGFSIELPKGFVPQEIESETLPIVNIELPDKKGWLIYVKNFDLWENSNNFTKKMSYIKDEKIGLTTFKIYELVEGFDLSRLYLFRQGNIAYVYFEPSDIEAGEESYENNSTNYLETFKFIGWPQVEGSKEDLISFSIKPGQEVSGKIIFTGSIKGGYFFEGNIIVNILDENRKIIRQSNANAVGDWITDKTVLFEGTMDFSSLPKGKAYIEIHNDNASGLPENDKSILIPIVIK